MLKHLLHVPQDIILKNASMCASKSASFNPSVTLCIPHIMLTEVVAFQFEPLLPKSHSIDYMLKEWYMSASSSQTTQQFGNP